MSKYLSLTGYGPNLGVTKTLGSVRFEINSNVSYNYIRKQPIKYHSFTNKIIQALKRGYIFILYEV